MVKASSPTPVNMDLNQMDFSLKSWLTNAYMMLEFPIRVLLVIGLLVVGTFAEMAPRKSLELLDNVFGSVLFFIIPIFLAVTLDWATGLLAAVVSLIIFTRLQRNDVSEGFSNIINDISEQSTKIISNPHRWFIERALGERPIAISSDRVGTTVGKVENIRTSSSSSMSTYPQVSHETMYTSMNLSPSRSSSSSNK